MGEHQQASQSSKQPNQLKFTMKSMMLIAVLLAVAGAVPQESAQFFEEQRPQSYQEQGSQVAIVKQAQEHDTAQQKYSYSFEADNGIAVSESGNQKEIGPTVEDIGTVARGSYSYPAPDGNRYTVNWVADENGFQPTGAHLPTPPPTPPHVIQLLNDLRAAG